MPVQFVYVVFQAESCSALSFIILTKAVSFPATVYASISAASLALFMSRQYSASPTVIVSPSIKPIELPRTVSSI